MIKRLIIKVFGRVQGVFFRYSAQEKIQELKIKGFARNEQNGSVYIEAAGEEEKLEEFVQWCRNGPPFAKVDRVEIQEGE